MQTQGAVRPTNRFLGEVHERDGIGLRYETASGGTGVVWLIQPSDPETSVPSRMTVLGRYLVQTGAFSCPERR